MKGLFPGRPFTAFGPAAFDPSPEPPQLHRVQRRRGCALRSCVRQQCPRLPGVYGMIDARGELVYVGKAKCLRARLSSYFRPASRDPKAGRILQQARAVIWEHAPNEFAALLRELELIQRWQPRFNVRGRPGRRRVYICLGRQPAPYAFLAARPPSEALGFYGPVPGGWRGRQAVRRLNDLFQLRDCPRVQEMIFADQEELFPVLRAAGCIRHEIGTCLGPCVAACSRSAYLARVHAARLFLEGLDLAPLRALEQEMVAAANAQAFEQAAARRDKLDSLRWLQGHLERLRQARQRLSFIYPVAGHHSTQIWYLIQRGRVQAAIAAPRDRAGSENALRRIETVFRNAARWPASTDAVDAVFLVAAWFRRHPQEQGRIMHPQTALAACRRFMQG